MKGGGDSSNSEQALHRLMSAYFTKESREKGWSFKPHASDVIISSAVRSGTTWVQHICHGLKSQGNMDFEEISLVVPCLEMAHDYGYEDLSAKQPYEPRMYKTHFWFRDCPKGAGKYVIVVRGWFCPEVTLEDFMEWIYLSRGAPNDFTANASQIHHILSWYPHRLDHNVLWLHYEDLKEDLSGCVKTIAEFLGIGKNDADLQDLVTRQASYEFMKAHASKFDEHMVKSARKGVPGLPENSALNGHGKLSNRVPGDHLPDHIRDKINQKWTSTMTLATGHETYEVMRESVNRELGRKLPID